MGIIGLLPLLKSIQKNCHIREWAGRTVGVDAYGWLHKGTISCAVDLALGRPTAKYVDFVMNRVKMLHHFEVTPYLVFDGDYLPSKAGTEAERERKRVQCKATGLELLKLGRTSQAHLELQKSIDVNPTMARHVIDACAALGVKCLVAPYEADSQLYYLEKMGIVDAIVSEDSDLLVFGVKCLITKLDPFGECIEINRDRFTACKEISLVGWTQTEFRHMCILSGCDYLENIPLVGLKTAHQLMRRHRDVGKVVRQLQLDGKRPIPHGYLDAFRRADFTFQHQRVFCPNRDRTVMANDPDPGITIDDELLVYIGPEVEAEVARRVARGDLDPITKVPIIVAKSNPQPQNSRLWAMSAQSAKKSSPPKNNTSIKSFFKPKSENQPIAGAPLQLRNVNQPVAFNSVSAPAKTSSTLMSSKRPITDAATSEPKKPRITTFQKRTDTPTTPQTAERSPFFQAQSRRSFETPTPKIRPAPSVKHRISAFAQPDHLEGDSETLALEQSLSSPVEFSVAAFETVDKVAKGWKELNGFSRAQKGGSRLSEIIQKQHQGSVPRMLTTLPHLQAKTLGNPRRNATFKPPPLPEPSTDSDTSSRGSQGSNSSTSTSRSRSQSPDDSMVSSGMFDKFIYDKR